MRRFVLLLTLSLVSVFSVLGLLVNGASSSKVEYVEPLLPVEARALPAPPDPPPPAMEQLWAAAIAQGSSPTLATNGKTGTSGGKIALTFDDGPDLHTTPLILDTLREHNIKATFFVVGRQVAENPDLLRRIVEEGHSLGNHTYNHANMSDLSPQQMRQELQSTQNAVDDALGYHYPMTLMRPPYGNPYFDNLGMLPVFRKVVREQGLFVVMWTVDSDDYLFEGLPQKVVRRVVRADRTSKRKEGSDEVLLLHDTHQQTADALPRIIDYYEASGLEFADVPVLLASKYAAQ